MKKVKILGIFLVTGFLVFMVACNKKQAFTINFDSNGGTTVKHITTNGKSKINIPKDPTKEGFSFGGWYWDNDTFNHPFTTNSLLNDPITSNVTVYASWEINQYTITFDSDGGSPVSSITQDYQTEITKPSDPTKDGYTFKGWDTEIPTHMPSKDITIKALWEYGTYYGKYPQTVVSDSSLISVLKTLTQTNSEGYYEYNGAEYAKVTASPFDSNYQFINGTTIVRGQTYYFKVEPIKWRVISNHDGTRQLLSEYIIDAKKYYQDTDTRTINGKTIYPNNYEHSDIRTWLNNTFYNKAFDSIEQNAILTTLVDNSAATTRSSNNPYASENTNDKIYLLSFQEVININYGFVSSEDSSETRMAQTTDYARAIGVLINTETSYYGSVEWWLRSPSSNYSNGAYVVDRGGGVSDYTDFVGNAYFGVRPVLQIR